MGGHTLVGCCRCSRHRYSCFRQRQIGGGNLHGPRNLLFWHLRGNNSVGKKLLYRFRRDFWRSDCGVYSYFRNRPNRLDGCECRHHRRVSLLDDVWIAHPLD